MAVEVQADQAAMQYSTLSSPLLSVDDLAAQVGLTVRTIRYYASLGLVPPSIRCGRHAWYSTVHRAHLDLVVALQDHGYTLAAIQKWIGRLPDDPTLDDLVIQRALLTSWDPGADQRLTRTQLDEHVGRELTEGDLAHLLEMGGLERLGDDFLVHPGFGAAVDMLDLDVPLDGMVAASRAIDEHMDALAHDLNQALYTWVLAPRRRARHTADSAAFEAMMIQLREVAVEAVVGGFQRATNRLMDRSPGTGRGD